MIRTRTSIGIRTQLILFQLDYVIGQTVKDDRLSKMVKYCIPERTLKSLWIRGVEDRQVHAKMKICINPENDGSSIDIQADFGDEVFTTSSDEDRSESSQEGCNNYKANCRIWAEAIEWFVKLCQQENLTIEWGVVFSDRHEEMVEKFGLKLSTLKDKTENVQAHSIPSSTLSELGMEVSFSQDKYGE